MTTRIAMWSGPRNISTAMMRSWENRADCSVIDEPFYAYYLQQTQSPHPLFDEILSAQPNDYNEVARNMSEGECSTALQYQKHMTHHMLENCDLSWTKQLKHCFLIRDPAYVVNSYTNSRGVCSAQDIGIKRQFQLYETITQLSGQKIPVVDSLSVLNKPQEIIPKMCEALGVAFMPSMLSWPRGKRQSDGVWASHWYHSVEASTGFAPAKKTELTLNSQQRAVVDEVMPYYEALKQHVIA